MKSSHFGSRRNTPSTPRLLCADFDSITFGITIGIAVRGFHDADMIEEKRDAARLAHRADFEQIPNLRRGAISIVSEAFNYDRHLVRREPFK